MNFLKIIRGAVFACLAIASTTANSADQVTIKIGYPAGGGFDNFGRLLSRHIGKHLEGNPSIVVQNVPGGGSLKLALSMQSAEPGDGSVIGMVGSTLAAGPMLDPEMKDLDPTKFKWLGSMSNQSNMCMTDKISNIATLEDFKNKEFVIGSSGKASTTYIFAALVKNLLHAKYKIVTGFEGASDIEAAMQRGEIAGRCGTTYDTLVSLGTIDNFDLHIRVGPAKSAATKAIPGLEDFVTNDLDKAALDFLVAPLRFHQAFILPSSTPDDIVAKYRTAFAETVKDPEFLADVKNINLVVDPQTGDQIDVIVSEIFKADPAAVARARELIQ